jgi:hypothetical protein
MHLDGKTTGEYWMAGGKRFDHSPTTEELDEIYKLTPVEDKGAFSGSAKERKQRPVASGVLNYFPLALMEVAYCSFIGNEQHNPGTPLHWDRSKSGDEWDALMRHFLDRGKMDNDGVRHSAKVAWRALAALEKELEAADELAKTADDSLRRAVQRYTYPPVTTNEDLTSRSPDKGCPIKDCGCKR